MEYSYSNTFSGHFLNVIIDGFYDEASDDQLTVLKESGEALFLLPEISRCNDGILFSYDVSGYVSLENFYHNNSINYEDFIDISTHLSTLLTKAEELGVHFDNFIFTTDKIFINPREHKVTVCYNPLYMSSFLSSFDEYLCFCVSHISHDEEKLISLAYDMQNDSAMGALPIRHILKKAVDAGRAEAVPSCIDNVAETHETDENEEIRKPCYMNPELKKNLRLRRIDFQKLLPECVMLVSSLIFLACIIYLHVKRHTYSAPWFTILTFVFTSIIVYTFCNIIRILATPLELPIIDKLLEREAGQLIHNDIKIRAEDDTTTLSPSCKAIFILKYRGNEGYEDIPIYSLPFVIGKASANADGIINSTLISRRHCLISASDSVSPFDLSIDLSSLTLADLGSTNGTFLNGIRVSIDSPQPLSTGDIITLAASDYEFVKLD